jgi:hypothetical protein
MAALPSPRYEDPVAYCAAIRTSDAPDRRYVGPAVPDWIARALMRAVNAPASADPAFFRRAAWRCLDGAVLACLYGADIPCETKADTSRRPKRGMLDFCRDRPDAEVIPAVATGRATIFLWRFADGRPSVARQIHGVDSRGFLAEFWYRVAGPSR